MAKLRIPAGLAEDCEGNREIEITAETVADAIAKLVARWPRLRDRILDADGALKAHLLVLCNDRAVHADQQVAREVSADDELAIVFLAGGG